MGWIRVEGWGCWFALGFLALGEVGWKMPRLELQEVYWCLVRGK